MEKPSSSSSSSATTSVALRVLAMASASELPPPALLSDGESDPDESSGKRGFAVVKGEVVEEEEEEEEEEDDDDDDDDEEEEEEEEEEEGEGEEVLCLFCTSRFSSPSSVLDHCSVDHGFDLSHLRQELGLDFYDCLRLINYIRSQVASDALWSSQTLLEWCEAIRSKNENFSSTKYPWQDDKYLTPFSENDPLLYGFELDIDDDGTEAKLLSNKEIVAMLDNKEVQSFMSMMGPENSMEDLAVCLKDEMKGLAIDNRHSNDVIVDEIRNGSFTSLKDHMNSEAKLVSSLKVNDVMVTKKNQKENRRVSFAQVAARERYSINQTYFGSYSTFGIHREMLSDKIRTDAYEHAILRNPSLIEGAVVLDLGCGTGILSLFAAKAGAKEVIAVEGSTKMASIAKQVAKANGYYKELKEGIVRKENEVIDVVQGMAEELDWKYGKVDVIVSEWMGYCLLFESMLNSVLYARDQWLKPGGAILPDLAKMYVAGFGVGGTSLQFWENVYGFDMKCIGKEVLENAATSPIVDAIESEAIVTDTCLLQEFDLVTMAHNDVDFTSSFVLHTKASTLHESVEEGKGCNGKADEHTWCYGLVIWFDTHFTDRFCKENPVILTTSPYAPKTHWSQTLLTFQDPICLSSTRRYGEHTQQADSAAGTVDSPAEYLKGRISIARSSRHRSIDISLETIVVGAAGVSRQLPVQIFDM